MVSACRETCPGSAAISSPMRWTARKGPANFPLINPMLATVSKVLQPFLRGVINGKLAFDFVAIHRMGELCAADPGQVSRQAETISELDKTELYALRVLILPSLTPARP